MFDEGWMLECGIELHYKKENNKSVLQNEGCMILIHFLRLPWIKIDLVFSLYYIQIFYMIFIFFYFEILMKYLWEIPWIFYWTQGPEEEGLSRHIPPTAAQKTGPSHGYSNASNEGHGTGNGREHRTSWIGLEGGLWNLVLELVMFQLQRK